MAQTPVSLLERLRARPEAEAWNRFVQLYTPLIHGWLSRYQLPWVDVEDLTQDVLTVVIQELPGFQHNGQAGAFRCWLRQITVHRLRTLWRARRKEPQGTGDSDFLQMLNDLDDPDSVLSRRWDEEHDHHLACRLLHLIEHDFEAATWQAFRRLALENARAADVAAELGLSVNAVLLAKSRVLRRLRQEAEGFVD